MFLSFVRSFPIILVKRGGLLSVMFLISSSKSTFFGFKGLLPRIDCDAQAECLVEDDSSSRLSSFSRGGFVLTGGSRADFWPQGSPLIF